MGGRQARGAQPHKGLVSLRGLAAGLEDPGLRLTMKVRLQGLGFS